ncbi:MAG TPA: hypothetical protein VGS13_09825 [Stellaceae bacterium]|nr:hypothetical protein [Stellaceae bacterium]
MRINPCLALALAVAFGAAQAVAQPRAASPAATRLAAGHLASVIDQPLFLRLYRIHLPAGEHAPYDGSSSLFYDLSGAAAIDLGSGATRPLAEGAGAFIAAGQAVTISAGQSEPSEILLFILTARPNERWPIFDRPASTMELLRTPEPLPGLKAGPYEFSLSRVTLPIAMPAGAPESRSGAALDYVLSGTGALTADGKTETLPPETSLVEGFGRVHQWANPGAAPLVLLQANVSREGEPAVVPATAK